MPKCGSSSIQSVLSQDGFRRAGERRLAYVAILESGRVVSGKELTELAEYSPHGYCSSHDAIVVNKFSKKEKERVQAELFALGKQFEFLVLSNESWGPHPDYFQDDCIFSHPGFDVSLISFVRPQVEWMNSAWWQWGAWTNAPIWRWINNNRPKADWHLLLNKWKSKKWVNRVDVKLMEADVVSSLFEYLDLTFSYEKEANRGLPESVLRLFQRHRDLRPGPHDSAIEFVISHHLNLQSTGTPWVVPENMVRNLLEYFREGNQGLGELLGEDQKEKFFSDSRWWSVDSYQRKILRPPVAKRVYANQMEELAVEAIRAVYRLDQEVRRLRRRYESAD